MLWLTLRQLKSKQAPARRRAAEALCQSPDPKALPALTGALADPDAGVRAHVVTALGKLENEERLEPLLQALRDREPEVLKAALRALKNVVDDRVRDALIPLLKHNDPAIRGRAATMLDQFGWKPQRRDEEISFWVARGQMAKAATHGAVALPALESVLRTGAYNQRVAAVEAIGHIEDQRAVRPLLDALNTEEPAVTIAAINALGEIGGEPVYQAILKTLRHNDGHVRTAAVEALTRLGAACAVEALKPMLQDPVWDVRRAVAAALGKLKDPHAVEALTQTLNDSDSDVREAGAIALGCLSDRRAIGPLVKALKDSTSGVRRIAAAALSRIDEDWSSSNEAQSAVEELKGALQDKDPNVRYAVSGLLNSLGVHTPAVEALSPSHEPSSSPEKRRKLAVSLLLASLCDTDRILRQAAAESLGRLGDRRAEPALQRSMRDTDLNVRLASEQALLALQQVGEAS